MNLKEELADYFSRKRYTTLEKARGTIGELSDYRDADQLLTVIDKYCWLKDDGQLTDGLEVKVVKRVIEK